MRRGANGTFWHKPESVEPVSAIGMARGVLPRLLMDLWATGVVCLPPGGLLAQGLSVRGQVTTVEGKPVSNALVEFVDTADTSVHFEAVTDTLGRYVLVLTAVRETKGPPAGLGLCGNYPNPFGEGTAVWYQVPRRGPVQVTIYDLLGRRRKVISTAAGTLGPSWVWWDGTDDSGQKVGPGVYLYVIAGGGARMVGKMLYLGGAPGRAFEGGAPPVALGLSGLPRRGVLEGSYDVFVHCLEGTSPPIWSMRQKNIQVEQDTVLNFEVRQVRPWRPLGLDGKEVEQLVLAGDSLYACAARAGLFRCNLGAEFPEWEYVGFALETRPQRCNFPALKCCYYHAPTSWLFVGIHPCDSLPERALLRSEDGGQSWIPSASGLPAVWPVQVNFLAGHDSIVLAGSRGAIFRSTDHGRTWQRVWGHPQTEVYFQSIVFCSTRPGEVWAGGGKWLGDAGPLAVA